MRERSWYDLPALFVARRLAFENVLVRLLVLDDDFRVIRDLFSSEQSASRTVEWKTRWRVVSTK